MVPPGIPGGFRQGPCQGDKAVSRLENPRRTWLAGGTEGRKAFGSGVAEHSFHTRNALWLFKPEALDLVDEAAPGDAQQLGRMGAVAAGLFQGGGDGLDFVLFEGLGLGVRVRGWA